MNGLALGRPLGYAIRWIGERDWPQTVKPFSTQIPAMEVKVQCDCGTRYKFDVEPVGGRMPGPVQCPSCQADGTAAAEAIIQQTLAGAGEQIAAIPAAAAAPPPPKARV